MKLTLLTFFSNIFFLCLKVKKTNRTTRYNGLCTIGYAKFIPWKNDCGINYQAPVRHVYWAYASVIID